MAQALRSTRVLTPEGLKAATIVIEREHIHEVRLWNHVPPGAALHDFGDHLILPGLVDTHVHINEPGRTEWEGFWTATRAAAAGGVTTLVDMPLNCVPETITVEALEAKRAAARNQAWVDWAAWGGVVRGNQDELQPLAKAGVPGFKCFLIHSGIDGFQWVNESDLRRALEKLRGSELPLLAHAELAGPIEEVAGQMKTIPPEVWRRYITHLASRPGTAEMGAIAMLLGLAGEFDSPLHVVHLSCASALTMLEMARRRGLPITVETCPHYLWFAAEEIPDGATEYKCAPPIRRSDNRERLWQALEAGLIDMVVTDHSPCPPAMKHREDGRFDLAWGGIASLGLALPVMWTALNGRGFDVRASAERVGKWMCASPARLAGLTGRKGALAAGSDADIVIFDPGPRWTVSEESLWFRHRVSPYLGETPPRPGSGNVVAWRDNLQNEQIPKYRPWQGVGTKLRDRAARVIAECQKIAEMTEEPGRITRRFLTPPVNQVHAHLQSRMEALGMRTHVDAAGNLRGFWQPPGASDAHVILGSHIDTVPDGGAFDGVLGVVLALEWVEIAKSLRLPLAIEVIAFSEEEGVRFRVPFIGSRAVSGRFDPGLLKLEDVDGVTMEEAIRRFGLNPGEIGNAAVNENALAFVEIHIEQGPVLDAEDLSVAAVSSIVGQTRLQMEFQGQANHAGTTPMHLRRDALAAAAEWIAAVERFACDREGLMATIGKISVKPNTGNVVPGAVEMSLDVRHSRDVPRRAAVEELLAKAEAIADRRGLSVGWSTKMDEPSVPMDERLIAFMTAAIEIAGFPPKIMPSGAGHDAMVMAGRMPAAMLFLRSPGGISHSPAESVREEDVEASLRVGSIFLERLAGEVR